MIRFDPPLLEARLVRRYKRFLADIEMPDGEIVVAHCANPGSMLGCNKPGSKVYLSPNTNPKAKLAWRWEMIEVDGYLVGINTAHPNRLAEMAIGAGLIPELAGYDNIRREVPYGEASRIDLLLQGEGRPPAYVEIKNVSLRVGDEARFPDSVTARGTKHLHELMAVAAAGERAVMLFLVQRGDCAAFRPAWEIDPKYAAALSEAHHAGVEILVRACHLSPDAIALGGALPLYLQAEGPEAPAAG